MYNGDHLEEEEEEEEEEESLRNSWMQEVTTRMIILFIIIIIIIIIIKDKKHKVSEGSPVVIVFLYKIHETLEPSHRDKLYKEELEGKNKRKR